MLVLPKGIQLGAKRDSPQPTVSLSGESKSIVSEHLTFPACGALPQRPTSSHPTQNTEVISPAEWLGKTGSRKERWVLKATKAQEPTEGHKFD